MVLIKSRSKFLRKNRKWPHSSYKTKWHETFAQNQAMISLREAAAISASPSQNQQHENPRKPYILSSLINSFNSYNCHPTPDAYHFLLKTLINTSQSQHIPSVLDRLESIEKFETPEYIFADMIKDYGDDNRIQDAIDLFCRLPQFRCVPTVLSLNTLLVVLCRNKEGLRLVPHVLSKSQVMKIRLEESSFRILIITLCRLRKVGHAIKLLKYMIDDGHTSDVKLCSFILSSLCKQKGLSSKEIIYFLEEIKKIGFTPCTVDYINVIRVLVNEGRGMDSLAVLSQMKVNGIKPDIVCYTLVLSGVVAEENYAKADELFDELLALGLIPDIYTYNAYIKGLCQQNNVEEGIKMVACMEEIGCKPNIITYNTLMEALYKNGEINRVKELARKIVLNGMKLNSHTYRIMLDALIKRGDLIEACAVLEEMVDRCFYPQCTVIDGIICGLCQKRMVHNVLELLNKLVDRSILPGVQAWEALLHSTVAKLSYEEATFTYLVNTMQIQAHLNSVT